MQKEQRLNMYTVNTNVATSIHIHTLRITFRDTHTTH